MFNITNTSRKIEHERATIQNQHQSGGCVASVRPVLNATEGICEWNVHTTNRTKVLTIKTDSLSASEVIAAIEKAGFKAEAL